MIFSETKRNYKGPNQASKQVVSQTLLYCKSSVCWHIFMVNQPVLFSPLFQTVLVELLPQILQNLLVAMLFNSFAWWAMPSQSKRSPTCPWCSTWLACLTLLVEVMFFSSERIVWFLDYNSKPRFYILLCVLRRSFGCYGVHWTLWATYICHFFCSSVDN